MADKSQKTEFLQQMTTDKMTEMNSKFEAELSAKDDQITMLFKQNEAILQTLTKLSETKHEKRKILHPQNKTQLAAKGTQNAQFDT